MTLLVLLIAFCSSSLTAENTGCSSEEEKHSGDYEQLFVVRHVAVTVGAALAVFALALAVGMPLPVILYNQLKSGDPLYLWMSLIHV